MRRPVIGLLCVLLLTACRKDRCRDEPPAFEVSVVLGSQTDGHAITSLRVDLSAAGLQRQQTLDVAGLLDDGRTTFAVDVGPAGADGFVARVDVAALGQDGAEVARGQGEFIGSGDACNFFELTLSGPGGDAGVDSDLPSDSGPDLPPSDGGPDLPLDAFPIDATKPCSPPCSGTTPVCDLATTTCQACKAHNECADGLCALDGSCPAASDIAHVDTSQPCPGTGSKASPYCTLADATAGSRQFVLVQPGAYGGDLSLDHPQEIHGEPGAILKPLDCDKLRIEKAQVTLVGFVIQGNVRVGLGGTAVLLANRIGPSPCIGIVGDSKVTLERNFVFGHDMGGIALKDAYSVVNNIIVKNGSVYGNFGAIKLEVGPTGSRLMHNTIAFNMAKGSVDKEAAVRCEASAAGTVCVNCLFWGNTPSTEGYPMGPKATCNPVYSIEDYQSPAPGPSHSSNFTVTDPKFVSLTPGTNPADYHIQPSSSARDKGDPTFPGLPTDDFDGDPRSDGLPDIGADEI